MTVLMVPRDETPYPSLGAQVCAWIEEYLVFGPGDLLGEPAQLDDEKRALIYRLYEVYPKSHPQAGRRRFRRAALSLRKGSAKTELGAWIVAAELHPYGPVRCDGFGAQGQPVAIGVTDPYIPMVAYTEEQSDELAYGALKVILEHSDLVDDFDIGLTRIMRIDGNGKAVSLSTAPDARDGARTTFQLFDETHRLSSPRHKAAHRTMLANLPKRKKSDAWSLEITTAFSPGEGSVAEDTMEYARQVADGSKSDSRLFFFHRQASDQHDLSTRDGLRAAVLEASGPVAMWSDIDGIVEQWDDPTADKALLERLWLNRLVRASERAFDVARWKELERPDYMPAKGALVALGFDGARFWDSSALVATEIPTGFQWLPGLWERPAKLREDKEWEVPIEEVDELVAELFRYYNVWRLYADPPYWETLVAQWAGRYGEKRVLEWWTNRRKAMAYAVRGFENAIASGDISHDGNADYTRHVGNAMRQYLKIRDENDQPLWWITKERSDSPFKIDAIVAGILSWEARSDALAAGARSGRSVYEERGLAVV